MVDLMSHVFSPRDIQEKWVGHVDFQLPSKRQKPSGKPPSSNKGLKNGCNAKKIAQPFSSFLSFGTPTIDAKTGFAYKIPFSRTQQTKWFRSNSYFWSSFCKPFHYWRNN